HPPPERNLPMHPTRFLANPCLRRLLPGGLALAIAFACVVSGRADEAYVRIAVRSDVDQPFQGWSKAPLKEHGKLYYLASIKEGPSALPMVKPVDQGMLRKLLVGMLAKQGFRPITAHEMPDVILTVIYGRGFLENPYLKGIMVDYSSDPPVETLDGLDTEQIIKERDSTFEEHLQNAQFEKLFMRVSAWAYPGKPPPKPKHVKPYLLWKTTVLIDDPINRDLNQYIEKMLEAAAPYFDHKTPEEEAFSSTTVPEGYVKVGDAKVVPPKPDTHK
ncbi:MAG: hypothetical protein ACHQ4G_09035, partial [Opitutales bacterium]